MLVAIQRELFVSQIAGGGELKNKYNCSSDGGLWADEKWSTPDDAGIVGGREGEVSMVGKVAHRT